MATATAAFQLLEQRGWVEARPKSGYYARIQDRTLAAPTTPESDNRPRPATTSQLVMEVMRESSTYRGSNFSTAIPDLSLPIHRQIRRVFTQVARTGHYLGNGYDRPEGLMALRQQIARRSADTGVYVSPETVITTLGCQHALALCAQSVTEAGDIVAVESPCYYGLLQMLESYGLTVIEIPSHPQQGMSLEALELAFAQWPIKAVLCISSFSNPLGCTMPSDRKQQLVALANRRDVPIIEDDIYADLYFHGARPKPIKAFDREERVMLCSSLSKTLDPQLRVGWILPGRYREQVIQRKYINVVALPSLTQQVAAELLSQGAYDRHLRQARECYRQRGERMADLAIRYFPNTVRMSRPNGGLVAWFEMPAGFDATALYHQGYQNGILLAPGELFSNHGQFRHCFRLSYAMPWTVEREAAMQTLGRWLCAA